jgi:hypothetical protein
MKRSPAFVGALVLAAAQTTVALSAPSRGAAPSHPAAPPARAAARAGSAEQDDFKLPLHLDVRSKSVAPLPHNALQSPQAFAVPWSLSPYRRYGLQSMPGSVWYPALSGLGCAGNNFFRPPGEQAQQHSDITLGSLVDGKSNLLSPRSYDAGLAAGSGAPATASSNALAFQAALSPTACGASANF